MSKSKPVLVVKTMIIIIVRFKIERDSCTENTA
jgi:hypothetical protein